MVDKIALGELEVVYKPTDKMWADINTKPLNGEPYHFWVKIRLYH